MKKRNFICDFNGCNRVFTQSNHLKQHKDKLHFANRDRYFIEDSKINKENHDSFGVDVDWEHELDEEEQESEEIVLVNYALPPIILQNPEFEG